MAFNRDSSLDISLGIGSSGLAACSDGTTLWFVEFSAERSFTGQAVAYVAATRARDSAKDIALGAGSWQGAALLTVSRSGSWRTRQLTGFARAYVAATRARDAAKDINLGAGGWRGGVLRWHHALVRG